MSCDSGTIATWGCDRSSRSGQMYSVSGQREKIDLTVLGDRVRERV